MNWSSVRVRLTLWNVFILALVLGGFGWALCYSVRSNQSAAIDRDLLRRAEPFSSGRMSRGGRHFHLRIDHGPGGDRDRQDGLGLGLGLGLDRRSFEGGRGRGEERFGSGRPANPQGGGDGHRSEPGQAPRDWPGPPPGPPPSRLQSELPAWETGTTSGPDFGREVMVSLEGKSVNPFENRPLWDPDTFEAAAHGQSKFSTVFLGGQKVRVLSAPARRDGVQDAVVQFAHPLGELQRLVDSQLRTLFVLIPLALAVAALGGLFLTSYALRPVRRVTQTAALIGAEDLSQRLEVTGKDELSELAATFNGMIERLEGTFARLSQAYRQLETSYKEQQRFTADASHELRTPLTRIKGMTSLALSGPHCADEYREALVVADQAADAMGRIVQDLLLLARADAGQLVLRMSPTEVEPVLLAAADRLEGHPGAPVRFEPPTQPLIVNGDADHLTRLVVNLLENAVRHTPADGEVRLSARSEEGEVVIRVADTGEGIAPEHLPHVCERFYRVDAARTRADGGTGLGLAICQSILQAHGGSLDVRSTLGVGTTVEVRLPASGICDLRFEISDCEDRPALPKTAIPI